MEKKIKGILVGCDDLEEGGYEWVINHNDWDNGNTGITNKLKKYKNEKDFKIYFYAFKTPTETPATTSDEFRGTIFGRAEIGKVELYKNDPDLYLYPHHVKLKNFELFGPKIQLEDVEDHLEKYGWSDKQKENNPFPNNLRQHGLLLTEKDCNLINNFLLKSQTDIIKVNRADNVKKSKIGGGINIKEFAKANSTYAGLLIGFYHRPKRQGYEYVLDSCEDDGRSDKALLNKVQKMKGKKAYFYIYESYEKEYWTADAWKRFLKESNGTILGKIFGEGLIKDLENGNIIFQYVTHYREYVDIDDIKRLSKRMESNGWNRAIIRLGLPLTQEECKEISSSAGVTVA